MEDIKTVALPERVIDQLLQSAGVSTYHPDGSQQEKLYAFAHAVAEEVQYRLPRAELQKDAQLVGHFWHDGKGKWIQGTPEARIKGITHPLFLGPQPKAATVPQGWKLVPVEPTQEMLKAQNWLNGESMYSEPLGHREAKSIYRAMLEAAPSLPAQSTKFSLGDTVRKVKGSQWHGRIVGTYSTELTPEGYAVESATEKGSVQIYPAAALERWEPAQSEGEQK